VPFSEIPSLNPNSEWVQLAPQFDGSSRSLLAERDMRPRPDFIKAYTHNGYFKSLKEIVHFYNTRDKTSSLSARRTGRKLTCCRLLKSHKT